MKVPPLNLTPDINRVGMALPFSPDLLWRYPLSLPQSASPSSPMLDVKNQMPTHLGEWLRGFQRRDLFFGGILRITRTLCLFAFVDLVKFSCGSWTWSSRNAWFLSCSCSVLWTCAAVDFLSESKVKMSPFVPVKSVN